MALIDKVKNPTYVKMKESIIDSMPIFSEIFGNGSTPMVLEPVPELLLRPTDEKIGSSFNNNAAIVFGRDRHPLERSPSGKYKEKLSINPGENSLNSGFGRHQGAGAIDIVVGRGAPFPMNFTKPSKLPPLYTTINDSKAVGAEITPGNRDFTNGRKHNGLMMDAARIYLSQMSDVDKYFKISTTMTGMQRRKPGTSAIILKGDNLRLHARRDIKIVAGGDFNGNNQKVDSAGNTLMQNPKIHIVVGNGKAGFTGAQPVPMGNNLVECITRIYETQQNILETINTLATTQQALNTVMTNMIPVVAPGLAGPPYPPGSAMGIVKTYYDAITSFNNYFQKFHNLPSDHMEFLMPSSKKYILSRSVFVNSVGSEHEEHRPEGGWDPKDIERAGATA